MAESHKDCQHPSTPAARGVCRKNRAAIAAGKAKDTPAVHEAQNELTKDYRENLLSVAKVTISDVKRMLGREVTLDDIDSWFRENMPELMDLVEKHHRDAALLTVDFLQKHASLAGFKAGAVPAKAIQEQLLKSLEVTGPVAFKTHIAGGGTPEAALDTMRTTLSGSAERLALGGARDTLDNAVGSPDSDVLGYSRRTGSNACDYCRGQSKDAVYDNNNFHAHDHCTCTGDPIYTDPQFTVRRGFQFEENFAAAETNYARAVKSIDLSKEMKSDGYLSVLVWNYTNGDFQSINGWLRGRPISTGIDIQNFARNFKKYFGEGGAFKPIAQDTAVYRGLRDIAKMFADAPNTADLTGVVFEELGLMSTSTSYDVAAGTFSKQIIDNNAVLRLVIPKGKKVMPGNKSEKELVLGPNTKIRIVKDYKDKNGRRMLDVEIVDD